jgi:hypothetical protein
MKTSYALPAVLACCSAAFAEVNPARPMITGKGNVEAAAPKVVVANQVADASGRVKLENFIVTGSLLPHKAAPKPAAAKAPAAPRRGQ